MSIVLPVHPALAEAANILIEAGMALEDIALVLNVDVEKVLDLSVDYLLSGAAR